MSETPVSVAAPAASVDEVLGLFDAYGADHYDEDVSQRDHALQCAALATAEGAEAAVVAAALLHDVGHLLDLRAEAEGATGSAESIAETGGHRDVDLAHEATGARWLARLFPPTVTAPIALHVAAKRYLCAVDPAYHGGLSAGSTRSLVLQGGPMSPDEVARFEQRPGFESAVNLRRWDDGGKVEDLAVAPLESYRPLLEGLAVP